MSKPYGGGKPTFNEFITPIGLVVHCYHDKPQPKTKDQNGQVPDIDEKTGIQKHEFKVTLAWEKTRIAELQELITMANTVKGQAWPEALQPGAFFALEPFFRDGDNPAHNTKGRDYLRGKYYLNFKQKADPQLNPHTPVGSPPQVIGWSGGPGYIGPNQEPLMPVDLYAGCSGRVSGIMFGTEYAGRHFISTRLNNIQKYQDGDRIGGASRPEPSSQFGVIGGGLPASGLPNIL